MELGAKVSQKLTSLISETECVLGQQIPFEIAKDFKGSYNERAHLDCRGEIPIIRIDEHYYSINEEQELTIETERLIAHELLHLKCQQEGFPSIRLLRLKWQECKTTQYLKTVISTIVEHSYVYKELNKLGYPAEEGNCEKLENALRKKLITDYLEPYKNLERAFHIAETLFYDNCNPSLIEYLTQNMPKTYDIVLKIVDAIKAKPVDPDSVRRTLIRLIRLIDELNPEFRPPISKRLIVDLVVSERQLQFPACEMINMEQFSKDAQGLYILMFSFAINNIYFCGREEKKPFSKKTITELNKSIQSLTLQQFLEKYAVKYTVRHK